MSLYVEPEDVSLHYQRVETSKGTWLIDVQTGIRSQGNDNVALKLIVETNIDEERIQYRRLSLYAWDADLQNKEGIEAVLKRIKVWIETTDGDGELNLVGKR